MKFFDYTVEAGKLRSRRVHESTSLVQNAVDVFRDMLREHGKGFKEPIAVMPEFKLSWNDEGGAAIATLWFQDIPVTTSVLLTGAKEKEAEVLKAAQGLVLRTHEEFGIEPAFDLYRVQERPVIMSAILPSAFAAGQDAVQMIADMETCLAAAFFDPK